MAGRDAIDPVEVVHELQALLSRHRPGDAAEERSLTRTLQLLRTTGSPFWRGQCNPGHLTASAIVVDRARARTLLVHHETLDRWLQPGGHFEPGETQPVEAAAREVREETGLATTWPGPLPRLLDVDVHPIPARGVEPAHYHYDLRYLLVAASDDPQPVAGDGARAVRWVARGELEELELDPGLRRALRKVWRGSSAAGSASGSAAGAAGE